MLAKSSEEVVTSGSMRTVSSPPRVKDSAVSFMAKKLRAIVLLPCTRIPGGTGKTVCGPAQRSVSTCYRDAGRSGLRLAIIAIPPAELPAVHIELRSVAAGRVGKDETSRCISERQISTTESRRRLLTVWPAHL